MTEEDIAQVLRNIEALFKDFQRVCTGQKMSVALLTLASLETIIQSDRAEQLKRVNMPEMDAELLENAKNILELRRSGWLERYDSARSSAP